MRIEVLGVSRVDEDTMVFFRCSCGETVGRWSGSPPSVGESTYVELECDDELEPGVNAKQVRSTDPCVRLCDDGRLEITATVLAKYEEGTVLLAFGDGQLQIEVRGDGFWRVGDWYTITVSGIVLYDMKL